MTLLTRTLGAADARGVKPETWSTLATVWAGKRDVSGREYFSSNQLHAESSTRFEIRYRSDLTTIHRAECEGVTYDIVHIAEIGRRKGLELVCKTVAHA